MPWAPTKLPKQQICRCTPTQATRQSNPQQTHRTIFTWVTSKQPTANTQDNIHLGYRQLAAYPNPVPLGPHFRHYCQRPFPQNDFHYEFAKGKIMEKCHETCRSRHSANLRANYVAARSQMYSCEVACIVVSSVGAFHVSSSHLLGKIA